MLLETVQRRVFLSVETRSDEADGRLIVENVDSRGGSHACMCARVKQTHMMHDSPDHKAPLVCAIALGRCVCSG